MNHENILKTRKKVIFFEFQAEGLTAIECWVIACIIFVFGALLGTQKQHLPNRLLTHSRSFRLKLQYSTLKRGFRCSKLVP